MHRYIYAAKVSPTGVPRYWKIALPKDPTVGS